MLGAQPREYVFPQTILRSGFRSSAGEQSVEVDDATLFPTSTPFRVRVGGEALTVVNASGTKWTITSGAEHVRPTVHKAGEIVELATARYGMS